MSIKKHYFYLGLKQIESQDNIDEYIDIEGLASTQDKDRDGDVVLVTGIDTTNFEKNPIILYQHDKNKPIGKVLDFKKTDNGLYVKARIYKDMNKEAYVGIKNGVLRTFSIGFIGKDGKYDDNTDTFYYSDLELLEISVVSVPANANALFSIAKTACGNGYCFVERRAKQLKEINKITIKNDEVSTKKWGDVDKTRIAQILNDINDKEAIDECYLYVEDYEKRSSWCCPHHEIKEDGTMIVNKNGVIAAYQALKGAHGNKPNMPDSAYEDAMKHIANHYRILYNEGYIEEIPDDLVKYIKSQEKGKDVEKLELLIEKLDKLIDVLSEKESNERLEQEEDNVETKDILKEALEYLKTLDDIEQLLAFYAEVEKYTNEKLNSKLNQKEGE